MKTFAKQMEENKEFQYHISGGVHSFKRTIWLSFLSEGTSSTIYLTPRDILHLEKVLGRVKKELYEVILKENKKEEKE